MKKQYLRSIFIAALFCMILSCSKEGLQGPDGVAGPAGPAGPAGAVGPAGKDGSVIYSGSGTPSTIIGSNGDYYLDRSTGNLYGPKSNAGWSAPLSLTGPAGPQGPAGTVGSGSGSQILSGNGYPFLASGNNGDYYLDKSGYTLYGPKTSSGWGAPLLLRGASGPQGPVGPAGVDGSIIYSGTGSPDPALGNIKDYYFDKTSGGLYGPKTSSGWGSPTSLVGLQGAAGATGSTGGTGAAGSNGIAGSQILSGNGYPPPAVGSNGDYFLDKSGYFFYGPKTTSGWGAPVLLRGAQGVQGPVGPAGANGSIIYSGSGTPDPGLGTTNDYYFDKTTGALYGSKTSSGWGASTPLIGPQGATGATGATGSQGNTGATGATGAAGSTILSGAGAPAPGLGNIGDFYLDKTSYLFYGPKTASGWGIGTSLKTAGASAKIIAFETADNTFLSWMPPATNPVGINTFVLRQQKINGDTSTLFKLPDSVASYVNHGIVLVYLYISSSADTSIHKWVQLSYSVTLPGGYGTGQYDYNASATASGGTHIQIVATGGSSYLNSTNLLVVKKVRIVVAPQSSPGTLGFARSGPIPFSQAMRQLNLSDKSFIKIH